ncbi:hypothetical protein FOXB_13383 [Fusarium oxysporum f. sp. conglutinans Fo5176]|uniref:SMP-30/Gluconolactonase/LRE-like region domain-containing protein n=1 Tax=Fusarium oxysporum (strain Fo5176) TaxID=660025 RepID=F9G401_FUSOF|nr:hypothetical protein FOXB_13383 [Fusarium oxysporum f. sp. conglutinans Fo5176]
MPSSISVLAGVLVPVLGAVAAKLPSTAQIIDQKSFNVLKDVPPPAVANDSLVFTWPGVTEKSLLEKPFHVYDEEFYDVIGKDPSLTLIATSDTDPIFHEAVVWYPPTEEVFFVQNAGAPAAGTGLNKSSIIQKISLKEADAVRKGKQDEVKVTVVDSNPQVINPNGGTYYKGNIIFAGEGQGDDVPSALYLMNPLPPYNTTTLLNNYFGRQFNSLNDVGINPRNGDLYFTDTLYGYLQDFRPVPGLRNQVYRYNFDTGAVTVVADDFTLPNGIGFGPDGKKVYVTDTGIALGFYGRNLSSPASVYSFDVNQDGTLQNRKTFAYVASFIPDGVHTDSKGRVYAGCGDGVHVWNTSGKLIGKIYTGTVAANFQFADNTWHLTFVASFQVVLRFSLCRVLLEAVGQHLLLSSKSENKASFSYDPISLQRLGPAETCNQRAQPLTPAGGCTVISGLPLSQSKCSHLATRHSTFGEFMASEVRINFDRIANCRQTIVHDLLLDHIPDDRDKILSRLRRIKRRHEIKSSQGPPFRPAFVPLYDDDQVENMLGIPDFEQAKSDLPTFVSIPTIHLDKPRPRTFPKISHHVKFLLQYHYRFGMHNGTVQKPHFDLASILDGIRSPCVRQMWSLTLDSKNPITVSWLPANRIWPILSQGTWYNDQSTVATQIAVSEYFQKDVNAPHERLARLDCSIRGRTVLEITFCVGIIGHMFSVVVPGGWMLDRLIRKVGEHVLGVDPMDTIKFASFFLVLNRSTRNKKARGLLFGPLRTVFTFLPGRYNGEPLRNLPDETSKRGETLQDLEDKLAAAIACLKRHHGTVQSELQISRDNENKDMLRSIQSFEGNLSLACLLRMCTISIPTWYSITSQDMTDIFARRISRLVGLITNKRPTLETLPINAYLLYEWLVRDSVSQPQVYQISAISDELLILKEILHSQMNVVSQVAQSFARAIASSRPLEAVTGKTPESADVQASLGTGNGALGHERTTQIFNSLQRKSQIRHRQLAYDIERLQDATERLKSQVFLNAEYIGAEANSPTSGCFVHKDLKPKTKVSLSTSLLL